MRRHVTAICLAFILTSQSVTAQSREMVGYGRLFTNDFLAEVQDRWRSGSFVSSRIWSFSGDGTLPQQPGEVLELRLGAEIITPQNVARPAPGDRPFAGVLSAGLHTHFMRGGTDFALGGDLVFVGPQTRMDRFQDAFHDLVGMNTTSAQTRADQVGDAVYLSIVTEAGHDIAVSDMVTIRPFVEARAGVETLARVGADMTFGGLTNGELMVRDGVTGQRYRTRPGSQRGFAFLLGADFAAVASSEYFPESSGVTVRDTRNRYRGGIHWLAGPIQSFYGLTYLDKEFEGQPEGQFVGSIRIGFSF